MIPPSTQKLIDFIYSGKKNCQSLAKNCISSQIILISQPFTQPLHAHNRCILLLLKGQWGGPSTTHQKSGHVDGLDINIREPCTIIQHRESPCPAFSWDKINGRQQRLMIFDRHPIALHHQW
jgi:hypothetical protein